MHTITEAEDEESIEKSLRVLQGNKYVSERSNSNFISFTLYCICLIFFYYLAFGSIYKKIKLSVILRGGYAYSRDYVYYFCQKFQGLRLFKGLCLFWSLE